jgi:hypothetical protein
MNEDQKLRRDGAIKIRSNRDRRMHNHQINDRGEL